MSKWPAKKLGDFVLPTDQRDPTQHPDEEFVYIDIGAVETTSKEIRDPARMLGAVAPSRARKVVRAGDVIVATVRPALNAVALVPPSLDAQVCSTGFCILRAGEHINNRYMFHFTKSPGFVAHLVNRVKGANYPAVTENDVKDALLPLPPLPEQERFVRILDEAEALRRLRAHADQRTKALIPALFEEAFHAAEAGHSDWRIQQVGDLCDLVNGAAFKPSEWDGKGLPIIRIQNLNDPSKPFNYCSRPIVEKFRVRPGDILLSWSGTPGTSFGCFRWSGPEGWLNQHIFNVRLKEGVDGEFFIYAINARLHELIAKAHGGVGLQHVTKGTLNAVEVPLPPLDLQRAFAARVADIRELEAAQAASRKRLDDLFQSLLHRAFQGEL